jgi:hypothetical protein
MGRSLAEPSRETHACAGGSLTRVLGAIITALRSSTVEQIMKQFLAVYIGTDAALKASGWDALSEADQQARQKEGVQAWGKWVQAHRDAIVDIGTPLGKTLRVSKGGTESIRNPLTAFTVVKAESHEAAAKMFEGHPHFTIFPGDSVEIMECLPLPG